MNSGNGGLGGRGDGRVIDGRFELLERLGSGGMGTVWRARDITLHREVALKEVRPPDPSLPAEARRGRRERVLREARALARLSHPHVVTIHQIIDAEGAADTQRADGAEGERQPWIVMELLPGHTLQDRLEEGTLPPAEAARVGRQVLSALRAAHAAGIQHRDVKPANIMLRQDGSAVLTDFGIAALQGATSLTETGTLIGSPEYMAPERIRGTDNDPASDLWSLGLVLYAAVEGVSPMRRTTTLATLAAVLDESVPPPSRAGALGQVLTALLVRDPRQRPDAARLDALLAQVESGTAPAWHQPTVSAFPARSSPGPALPGTDWPHHPVPHTPPAPRRRTAVMVAVISVAVAVVAATALVLVLRGPGGEPDGNTAGGTDAAPPDPTRAPQSKQPTRSPNPRQPTRSPQSKQPTTGSPQTRSPSGTRGWVAQLHSENVSAGVAARNRRLATIRKTVPDARYVLSNNFASLNPGYWVIYAPGPFSDGREALRFCQKVGRTSANQCVGRYFSHNADDLRLICRPPASSPTGNCRRT